MSRMTFEGWWAVSFWLALLPVAGCVVDINEAPSILFAEATCGYEPAYDDWVWTFEADVRDPNGPWDVEFVDAHVYDAWFGTWIDGFPLDRTSLASQWASAWTEWDTSLYCGELYVIDFVAEDLYGKTDVFTVEIGDCRDDRLRRRRNPAGAWHAHCKSSFWRSRWEGWKARSP